VYTFFSIFLNTRIVNTGCKSWIILYTYGVVLSRYVIIVCALEQWTRDHFFFGCNTLARARARTTKTIGRPDLGTHVFTATSCLDAVPAAAAAREVYEQSDRRRRPSVYNNDNMNIAFVFIIIIIYRVYVILLIFRLVIII